MSRSYKHFPYCKDRNSSKWGKRQCNKRARKIQNLPNGNAYRKLTERWDYIYDYCSSMTWKEYKEWCEHPRWWKDFEEANYYEWYKTYKRK